MARPIVVSNGELCVGLNPIGMVHDFYFPYVGLENHTNEQSLRHKIGVYIDGELHWIDNGDWQIEQTYSPVGSQIGHTKATNHRINLALEFDDLVDSEMSAFMRNIHVINLTETKRQVRLFMHQVFIIANAANNRDTAQYLPESKAILHYKGRRVFVVSGDKAKYAGPFDSYSIGLNGIEGHEGIWRDAEDGQLTENPVEHGQVDSILQFNIDLGPHDSERVFYWIACGQSTHEALKIHQKVRDDGVIHRLLKTDKHWREWIKPARDYADQNIELKYRQNFLNSLVIMKAHLDRHGAAIASADSAIVKYGRDAYGYCWMRDASYVLWPLLRLGYIDEVLQFIGFSRRVLRDEGYFMHKFQSDGSLGSSWHAYIHDGEVGLPIQTDETAIVLFLLGQLHGFVKDKRQLANYYKTLVRPMANFLSGYVDPRTKLPKASYDLWEERYITSTYTTAVTYGALIEAADLAEHYESPSDAVRWRGAAEDMISGAHQYLWDETNQYFFKGLRRFENGDIITFDDFDVSSFFGAYMFGLWPESSREIKTAYQTLASHYHFSPDQPLLPRYENDAYFRTDANAPSNPWFVTSLWLAQFNLAHGDRELTTAVLDKSNEFMNQYNILSEQIHPTTGEMLSVAPLAWSHAEFVNTLLDMKPEQQP